MVVPAFPSACTIDIIADTVLILMLMWGPNLNSSSLAKGSRQCWKPSDDFVEQHHDLSCDTGASLGVTSVPIPGAI